MDPKKIFNLRNVFFLALAATILMFISLIVEAYLNLYYFFRLIQATDYFTNLNQIGSAVILYAGSCLRMSMGAFFTLIMLLLTLFLLRETTITLFNHKLTILEVGIVILIISIFNFFGTSGFVVGSILGILAGSFILVKKYFETKNYRGFSSKEKDFFIEVDLS